LFAAIGQGNPSTTVQRFRNQTVHAGFPKRQSMTLFHDAGFQPSTDDVLHAYDYLKQPWSNEGHPTAADFSDGLPEDGIGEEAALALLAPHVLGRAAQLGSESAFAHMDPPTPWITWVLTAWNASVNQNLLHPALSPFAKEAEQRVIDWIAPSFGMSGGHMTPGSTISSLTALWAARDTAKVKRVLASAVSHLSIAKSARILGLEYVAVPVNEKQQLDPKALSALGNLSDACLVLTAGTTAAGAIDPLHLVGRAAWTHVDAAWAGPLQLSAQHAHLLEGIKNADSIAISAHKWFFQPKESALVLFADAAGAHEAVSTGGAYLATPNVGVLGSHGAMATPLLATLLAWGRTGLVERIDRCVANAETLAHLFATDAAWELFQPASTGVLLARPQADDEPVEAVLAQLPAGVASSATVNGQLWLRFVAANPMVNPQLVFELLNKARKDVRRNER
jgi:L-2,4-diaminobutyrate decarboxylase